MITYIQLLENIDGAFLAGVLMAGALMAGSFIVGARLEGDRIDGARMEEAPIYGVLLEGSLTTECVSLETKCEAIRNPIDTHRNDFSEEEDDIIDDMRDNPRMKDLIHSLYGAWGKPGYHDEMEENEMEENEMEVHENSGNEKAGDKETETTSSVALKGIKLALETLEDLKIEKVEILWAGQNECGDLPELDNACLAFEQDIQYHTDSLFKRFLPERNLLHLFEAPLPSNPNVAESIRKLRYKYQTHVVWFETLEGALEECEQTAKCLRQLDVKIQIQEAQIRVFKLAQKLELLEGK